MMNLQTSNLAHIMAQLTISEILYKFIMKIFVLKIKENSYNNKKYMQISRILN